MPQQLCRLYLWAGALLLQRAVVPNHRPLAAVLYAAPRRINLLLQWVVFQRRQRVGARLLRLSAALGRKVLLLLI